MIKLVLYITSILFSLIAQSLANGCFCFARKREIYHEIDPIYNLNDTIKEDAADISNDNIVNNSEDNPENNSEDLSCHICQQETNSVTLSPCGHNIGNYCANKFYRVIWNCPFCNKKIDDFKNIVDLNDCEFDKRTIYRFRALTEIEFGRLKDSIENGMTDEEFMARFWYLRRCQEPDKLLLETIKDCIITKEDRKNIAELKAEILSSKSSITSELEMYQKTFKQEITRFETTTMYTFFVRLNIFDVNFEFLIRKMYLNCS
ncbi:uncharacterized protein LOC126904084 isoform X15 [Daktulosphaira vitifoliae]|uniref:uncharacterized protein LOC126904084 isoform X10 n=1 Tax=Daktulosphaira vitifoliae TaxID=58002 RepID=UPI0021AA3EAF|nr:uncharacterized protein LOC126904084 isoform X10 [Daktulosphaira vitifoliae]XP_050538734.1 uncharacterized protein LOC126904084 isoform X11 [Daktulosphaira vitifoliae]XP_050538735.1 uncharacterized protein LOC126904084 isoform X12 [Daktulosphaira vitifoliae]XP_050538736.1 uncharacterized protein LOC126904084 isoform X13 [Daktulosphaira vitifoliae]XP_050538738.1 uncharacterized protein LOC126904084 isoform X14 [Daktulosphaira vitifoliae]XP_050538739.1 uncharacterized protein LOC126904084 iso